VAAHEGEDDDGGAGGKSRSRVGGDGGETGKDDSGRGAEVHRWKTAGAVSDPPDHAPDAEQDQERGAVQGRREEDVGGVEPTHGRLPQGRIHVEGQRSVIHQVYQRYHSHQASVLV